MIFTETDLPGAFVIDVEPREDERGHFARAYCQREFEDHGLKPVIAQANLAYNRRKGTLRGMHFQIPPAAETKLVRATRGAILDVIVDLRPESPTYLRHVAVELTQDNHRALYVPERFAHGYQALVDETETSYQVGEFYSPPHERALPHDDPGLRLEWPLPVSVISEKDRNAPLLETWEERLKQEMTLPVDGMEAAGEPMIIVDNALNAREAEGNPIRVGMVGAGFMGRGLGKQIVNSVPGERLVAVYNRHLEKAVDAYRFGGLESVMVRTQEDLEDAIAHGTPAVTDDWTLLTRSAQIDALVDVTGAVEFGAQMALDAFAHGKHVILMNAELDATIGPILQVYAKKAGVILTACDGDQPGVEINLYRYVKGLGLFPRVMGNIKGLQDRYRNPTTQKGFAEKWGQNPAMVTSFADGSKVSFEQAVVANATGMKVPKRGMLGRHHDGHVDELTSLYDLSMLREMGGIVDYVVGATPNPGIYCLAEHPDPDQRHYLNLYKLGEGPLYSFYTPWHLCHFEVPNTVARVVLFGDAAGVPSGGPMVEVCACAKLDLEAGQVLDDYGMYMTYGEAVNSDEMRTNGYLPEGLVEGCRLKRDIRKDDVLTYDDVDLPPGRLADKLRMEQYTHFTEAGAAVGPTEG